MIDQKVTFADLFADVEEVEIMLGLNWHEEAPYRYCLDDREAGSDSGSDSELEEIELALYNQIHYQGTPSEEVVCEPKSTPQQQAVWVGPWGDNSQRRPVCSKAGDILVASWESKSECGKVKCGSLQGPDGVLVPNNDSCVKRKRVSRDVDKHEDSVSEDGYVGQMSSDSHDSGEDDCVLLDLQLNLSEGSGTREGHSPSPQGTCTHWLICLLGSFWALFCKRIFHMYTLYS